jgi:hypothetical protein
MMFELAKSSVWLFAREGSKTFWEQLDRREADSKVFSVYFFVIVEASQPGMDVPRQACFETQLLYHGAKAPCRGSYHATFSRLGRTVLTGASRRKDGVAMFDVRRERWRREKAMTIARFNSSAYA